MAASSVARTSFCAGGCPGGCVHEAAIVTPAASIAAINKRRTDGMVFPPAS